MKSGIKLWLFLVIGAMTVFGSDEVSAQMRFEENLSYGASNSAVRELQKALNQDPATRVSLFGAGSPGSESEYFGAKTRAAVVKFQKKYGIYPAFGFVGPITRAKLNSMGALSSNLPQAASALPIFATPAKAGADDVCNETLFADGLSPRRMLSLSSCQTLNRLYREGKAAGNIGDLYDNRDDLHVNFCVNWTPNPDCPKSYRLFPQHDWKLSGSAGAATSPDSRPTLGQASWSGVHIGDIKRSIPYAYYGSQDRADILYNLYAKGNLYVYPSLYDDSYRGSAYDASALSGSAELDPAAANRANTPYVIGSKQVCKCGADAYRIHDASGSDLPFIELGFAGLAAFKPEVKSALKEGIVAGGEKVSLLAPTLQAMIRYSHESVGSSEDYIKSPVHRGAYLAHSLIGNVPMPSFKSDKLVSAINNLSLEDVPPFAHISVVSEDFLDGEKLFTTPGAIARSVSVGSGRRDITVSAAGSVDAKGGSSGLEYRFEVLGGSVGAAVSVSKDDPAKATITFVPQSSGRIDIGVFVKKKKGAYYSTPGIISLHIR